MKCALAKILSSNLHSPYCCKIFNLRIFFYYQKQWCTYVLERFRIPTSSTAPTEKAALCTRTQPRPADSPAGDVWLMAAVRTVFSVCCFSLVCVLCRECRGSRDLWTTGEWRGHRGQILYAPESTTVLPGGSTCNASRASQEEGGEGRPSLLRRTYFSFFPSACYSTLSQRLSVASTDGGSFPLRTTVLSRYCASILARTLADYSLSVESTLKLFPFRVTSESKIPNPK